MKKLFFSRVFFVIFILKLFLHTPLTFGQGNHTWAKSEAWTWMGHLQTLETNSPWTLSSRGYAFIHYFTRNETGTGRMNFKSSAVTKTQSGKGLSYEQKIIFPSLSANDFQLKVHEDKMNFDFHGGGERDQIYETTLTKQDEHFLRQKLLPLYPGLKVRPQFQIQKFNFSAHLGKTHKVELQFFSLWPEISPPGQRMEFYGLKESFTSSTPMLLAYGTWYEANREPQRVVGLCFLDRQWSQDYFGKVIFANPLDYFKKNQALKWAHNWAAFHGYSPTTQDWYFIHLWQQVQRRNQQPDRLGAYSGIQWSKNGEQQTAKPLHAEQWTPTQFIPNQSKVLFNFAEGRLGLFPTRYQYQDSNDQSYWIVEASPKLQSLDQPIYLYEGYAEGQGQWDQQKIRLQGRVESSQILFRNIDYESILSVIDREDPTQKQLAQKLQARLEDPLPWENQLEEDLGYQKFLTNDLPRKIQILKAQFDRKPKHLNANEIIY